MDAAAFLKLMKIYAVDYTASHDQSVVDRIMDPDYIFRMGPHIFHGFNTEYRAATRKVFDQFPGLGFTVHEVHTNGERLMMRFTEHGASTRHGGLPAAWGGIGLYRWNGEKITSVIGEQDYYSRARQLSGGTSNPVEAPAIAPWDGQGDSASPAAEDTVAQWLETGRLASTPGVACDDSWTGRPVQSVLIQDGIVVNDLFSCGNAVGFHVEQRGAVHADFSREAAGGSLYSAGIVHVEDGVVVRGRVIRNRLELRRQLDAREPLAAQEAKVGIGAHR